MLTLLVTHVVMGAFGYVLGSHAMKTKIYKELMGYLDEKSKECSEKLKK